MGVGGFDPLYIGRISSAVVERVFFAPAPTTLVQIMSNTSMFLYYLFYAPTEKLARVHVGDCRHCNHGKGPSLRRGTRARSTWSGPFATCEEAVAQMKILNLRNSKTCSHCNPQDGDRPAVLIERRQWGLACPKSSARNCRRYARIGESSR